MFRWYIHVFKNYGTFDGRATRAEFWSFTLIHVIVSYLLPFIDVFVFGWDYYKEQSESNLFSTVYFLFSLIPCISVTARRLHDTGRNGWLMIIPFVSFYWLCLKSDDGDNEYGPPFHSVSSEEVVSQVVNASLAMPVTNENSSTDVSTQELGTDSIADNTSRANDKIVTDGVKKKIKKQPSNELKASLTNERTGSLLHMSDITTSVQTVSNGSESQKVVEKLKALKQLRDEGMLTEAEFLEKRNELLKKLQ